MIANPVTMKGGAATEYTLTAVRGYADTTVTIDGESIEWQNGANASVSYKNGQTVVCGGNVEKVTFRFDGKTLHFNIEGSGLGAIV